MGMKQNPKGQRTILTAILVGTAVSIIFALIGAAITAWTISTGKVGHNREEIAAAIILFLSTAVGTGTAAKMAERKKLQISLITGGTFLLVLVLMTALLFGGQYSRVWIGAVLTVAASLTTAMLSLRQGSSGNKKQWKKPYR